MTIPVIRPLPANQIAYGDGKFCCSATSRALYPAWIQSPKSNEAIQTTLARSNFVRDFFAYLTVFDKERPLFRSLVISSFVT